MLRKFLFMLLLLPALAFASDGVTASGISDGLNNKGRVTLYFNFDTGSVYVDSSCFHILDKLAEVMKRRPDMKISVQAHTDTLGTPEGRVKLSTARAEVIKSALMMRGIDDGRIAVKGLGSAHPIADNATKTGRFKNSRVDIVALK